MSLTGSDLRSLFRKMDVNLKKIETNTQSTNTLPIDANILGVRTGRVSGFGVAQITSTRPLISSGGFEFNSFKATGIPITFPSSAVTLSIASSSADDTLAGIGARTILITGLDGNYLEISEMLNLSGQSPVNSLNTYKRLRQIQVISSGSVGWNVGDLYISDSSDTFTSGIPDTRNYITVEATWNLSMSASITIPANKLYYLVHTEIDSDATESKPFVAQIFATFFSAPTSRLRLLEVTFNGGVALFPNNATILPPKTDFWVLTKSSVGTLNRGTIWFNFMTQDL